MEKGQNICAKFLNYAHRAVTLDMAGIILTAGAAAASKPTVAMVFGFLMAGGLVTFFFVTFHR